MRQDWEVKKLGDVCKTGAGGTPLKVHKDYYEGGDIPWLLSGEVNQRDIVKAKNFITEKGLNNSSAKLFPKNTILVAMYGATAGQVGILRFEASTNQAVCGILPNKNFLSEFFYYYFLHKKEDLIAQAVGNAQPNISQIKIKNTLVPIPPLSEQQRIVEILDEALTGIATIKANTERNLQNARELFQSYLQSIFSNLSDDWEVKKLGDVCEKITDGTHKTPTYLSTGIPFLSVKNLTQGIIDFSDTKFISLEEHEYFTKRCKPKKEDILYTKVGTTGVAKVVDTDQEFSIFVSVALLKIKHDLIFNRYLEHFLNSPFAREQAKKRTRGMANKNLVIRDIKEIEIHFPASLSEQQEIVGKLDALLAETKKLEENYQQKLNNLEELKKSILQKAFNGELTSE
jgi:type I restriction enzyme S subunit